MSTYPLLPGIARQRIQTARLEMNVLSAGQPTSEPVVLLHGNVSSARFWEETMLMLADQGAYVIAPDQRGYGDTQALPIDATRGLRDWSDDLHSLIEAVGIGPFHLIGWSAGGGIAMQFAMDYAAHVRTLTLVSAMSPFGFGGTQGVAGEPNFDDFAGSGGGTANPDFAQRLLSSDRGADSPNSPRNVMNTFYFKPPFRPAPAREEAFVDAMLTTKVGDDFYPGDMRPSANWPGVGPGVRGINNTYSPAYCNLSDFAAIEPQPAVLWIRGADDQIVSDTSFFDFGFLGQLGFVPGWPGADVYPAQPMVSQLRHVLDAYQANGGAYTEVVFADCGHSPHIEKPEEFKNALLPFIRIG